MNENYQEFQPNEPQLRHVHDQCRHYLHHHVLATQTDGTSFDGIILNVEADQVVILVGEDVMDRNQETGFDQYGGYGDDRQPRRYRRYRPRRFPLASLATLALLPYAFGAFAPYPYYAPYPYPPYPYY
ncbi:hypothetical protein [Aquibacillus sediminis]|uniref:hypothetical protein n=1 Tax=Aquibacillus sediminis TaxID=2574734 RepID=UPI001108214E|nr:hypothetical protein [Aquibacillus sediminis]